jgi:hypothetical protein
METLEQYNRPAVEPTWGQRGKAFANLLKMGHCAPAAMRTLLAGVMAIGLSRGEIENSYLRVLRMLAIKTAGGNAFDERLNKFNRSMNRGYRLSRWFGREFGSTQCQAITKSVFSEAAGVTSYIEGDSTNRC